MRVRSDREKAFRQLLFDAHVSGKVFVRLGNALHKYMEVYHNRPVGDRCPTREEIAAMNPAKLKGLWGVGKGTVEAFRELRDWIQREGTSLDEIKRARDEGNFSEWVSLMAMKQCRRLGLRGEAYYVIKGLMHQARDFDRVEAYLVEDEDEPEPREWPPEEDCGGCPGHKDGPHKMSCSVAGAKLGAISANLLEPGAVPANWPPPEIPANLIEPVPEPPPLFRLSPLPGAVRFNYREIGRLLSPVQDLPPGAPAFFDLDPSED